MAFSSCTRFHWQAQERFDQQFAIMLGGVQACRERYRSFAVPLAGMKLDTSMVLGTGRFGLVMKGWLPSRSGGSSAEPTTVAVKTINSTDDATVTQLLLEMRLLAAMRHPNLVALVAVQEVQLPLLLVMEFCEGGDLRHCLRSGFDHLRQVGLQSTTLESAYLDFACQAAAGVEYLHSKLCVHRDVAARNILVTRHAASTTASGLQLKLADLGLARIVLSEEEYYKVGRALDAAWRNWEDREGMAKAKQTLSLSFWLRGMGISFPQFYRPPHLCLLYHHVFD